MVKDIHSQRYSGKSVIVCWSHKTILQLAESFGVDKDDLPAKWKGKRFDVTWVIKIDGSGKTTFKQLPQRFLKGTG
jgi:hypothetical protein